MAKPLPYRTIQERIVLGEVAEQLHDLAHQLHPEGGGAQTRVEGVAVLPPAVIQQVIVPCEALPNDEVRAVLEVIENGVNPLGGVMIIILNDDDNVSHLQGHLQGGLEVPVDGPVTWLPEGLGPDHGLALGHGGGLFAVIHNNPHVRLSGLL